MTNTDQLIALADEIVALATKKDVLVRLQRAERIVERLRALAAQSEEEFRAITALRVTLFGVECWLPSSIAKSVELACAPQPERPQGGVSGWSVVPDELDEAMVQGTLAITGANITATELHEIWAALLLTRPIPPKTATQQPAQAVGEAWDGRGGPLWLDREQWGIVVDALIEHSASATARKSANSESNSDTRAGIANALIAKINAAALAPKEAGYG